MNIPINFQNGLVDASSKRGKQNRQLAKKLIALSGVAKRKQRPQPVDGENVISRRELTPPLMDDAERGSGDSTNARLHRLIGGRR